MSKQYYNNMWQETINDIQDLIQVENFQNEPDFLKKPSQDLFQHYAQNYIRYIGIYKKLEDCYDQMVHPQKKINLKELLELAIIRMIENKKLVIQYNVHSNSYQSDMVNLDELITDLKLTPDYLEVPIPRYFKKETDKERLDERNFIIDKTLQDMDLGQPEETVIEEQYFLDTKEENILEIIQRNERGRQGIQRGLQCKQLRKDKLRKENKTKRLAEGEEITDEQENEKAVLIIQKYFKGYKGREQVYYMREEEMKFLGIQRDAEDPKQPNSQSMKSQEQRQKMTLIQQQHMKDYEAKKIELKKLVQETEGPEIKEKKIKERIDWIDMYLDKTEGKKLPAKAIDYYDDKKRYPPSQEELDALKGGKKGAKKENKPEKKGKKGKKDKKEEKKDTIDLTTVVKINERVEEYLTTWGSTDDSTNFQQTFVTDVAKGLVRQSVETEMNSLVDELIEIELDNRHLFLLKKPRKRPPKPKPPKAPKPKNFKVPGAGGVKGRDVFDLLSELLEYGIVKKLMPANLADLKGGQNVLGATQEQQFSTTPDPSYPQLRSALAEFVGMQLGSPVLKEKLDKMSYFLFFGPSGSGKTLAIRALATECNAMLLDITPSSPEVQQKFSDKSSIGKTFYTVFYVAKVLHPTIIFMDNIEQVFGSAKKKKGVPAAPWAKLKKPLQDFKKAKFIEPTTRVVFIGCTNQPELMIMKDSKNFFEKKFFFPMLNYDTRLTLLKYFIEEKGIKLEPNFPLSTLAHLTEGYTAGSFKNAIDKIITPERIKKIPDEPITIDEFLARLSRQPYVKSQVEYDKLRTFFDEVTGTKERREKSKAVAVDPKKGGKKK
ncbi:unnamed protein product [Paramecium sonneborni]|uniref:ATPase AAA-type core domain-containing protein n=1 Tax=Paramecium sonneborni TaxID=65129 RepID=A0A8S1NU64_9CILI|nr:unnamed protein product [Paramecium sonneborni]